MQTRTYYRHVGYMQFRTQLAALNLPKTLPVGTADAGSAFTNANTLAAGSDFIMANVSPNRGRFSRRDQTQSFRSAAEGTRCPFPPPLKTARRCTLGSEASLSIKLRAGRGNSSRRTMSPSLKPSRTSLSLTSQRCVRAVSRFCLVALPGPRASVSKAYVSLIWTHRRAGRLRR